MMEGENADRFRKNFASTPWIKVPRVLWDYTAGQVRARSWQTFIPAQLRACPSFLSQAPDYYRGCC